ncbi:MAG: hypothetical protein AAF633_07160 [Chloroflexota bacterium]
MTFFFAIQIIIFLLFLYQFLRGSKLIWGVGLISVGSAILLNIIFNTVDREALQTTLGFWLPLMNGLIFSGVAFWLFGVLQERLFPQTGYFFQNSGVGRSAEPYQEQKSRFNFQPDTEFDQSQTGPSEELLSRRAVGMQNEVSEYDQKLLFNQIYQNLSFMDIFDLIFDLEMVENQVLSPDRNMITTINNIMDLAYDRDQMSDLALAVERILTPVPPDHFPRLSRITVDSPPTILRRYLLTFYSLEDLKEIADRLEIDWERLGIESKQQKVRNLLLHIMRRKRLGEFIEVLQSFSRKAIKATSNPE